MDYYGEGARRRVMLRGIMAFLVFVVTAIMLGAYVIVRNFHKDSFLYKIVSPLAYSIQKSSEMLGFSKGTTLSEVVVSSMKDTTGTYGIYIKHLKNGETYVRNENKIFDSASLYKLWVMATVFDFVDKGKIKEDEELSSEINKLNEDFDIASESAEPYFDEKITQPLEVAILQMITISHNYSALLLTKRVGASKVSAFIKDNGFTQSRFRSPPQTTASDIALFYEKLYKGEIVNPERSKEMIEILKKQQLNDRIPKYLPDTVQIAHKTGELGPVKHDGGIVYGAKGDYIFVVLSDSSFPQGAAERIATLSKDVFEYFED